MILFLMFLQYVLLLWGAVYLVTQSVIFSPVRRLLIVHVRLLGLLSYCPSCTGFWVGVLLGALGYWRTAHPTVDNEVARNVLAFIECGIASTALGTIWGHFFGNVELFHHEMAAALGIENDDG